MTLKKEYETLLLDKIIAPNNISDIKHFGNWVGDKFNIQDDRFNKTIITNELIRDNFESIKTTFKEEEKILHEDYTV